MWLVLKGLNYLNFINISTKLDNFNFFFLNNVIIIIFENFKIVSRYRDT